MGIRISVYAVGGSINSTIAVIFSRSCGLSVVDCVAGAEG